ncbi:MAG: tetratricopeptide repeat protein [Candidatus Moranbacteria bacterium]|nr:tetratricopeptide repeat protein [Candidatus Moranbacteria bacterium]
MSLSSRQKKKIKREIRQRSLPDLAREMNISEKDIEKYLRKIWSKKKYKRVVEVKKSSPATESSGEIKSFSWRSFFYKNRLTLILLFALVFACYINILGNEYVSDDIKSIAQNENIRSPEIFLQFSPIGYFFRITYFLAYQISQGSPVPFHLLNIFYHLGSVLGIFVLLSLLTKKRIAVIAASLFAVHPLASEAVTWMSGVTYAQYTFFFLFSFIFYLLGKQNRKYYILSVIAFLLCVTSSQKAFALILVFPLYEFLFGNLRLHWKKMIPYASLAGIIGVLMISKVGERKETLQQVHYQSQQGLENPLVQVPVAIVNYLKLFTWPQSLTLYHTNVSPGRLEFFLIWIVFLAFLGVLILAYKKNKFIFFWLAFFVISLLPTLTPLRISWVVAERYVYPGLIGLTAAVAILAHYLLNKFKGQRGRQIIYTLAAILLIALCARTIVRNTDWKNRDTLWMATAEVSQEGGNIHNNLGDVYTRREEYEKAVKEFKKAIEQKPGYADAYHNLANTFYKMGETQKAIENFQKALEFNPNLWQTHQQLAAVYFNQGDHQKALEEIKKALKINPENQQLQKTLQAIQSKSESK